MTADKTLCHLHEAGACYEGCPYAYSLLETLPAPLAALRAATAKAVKAGGAIYEVTADDAPCPCGATVFGEPASVVACGCTIVGAS